MKTFRTSLLRAASCVAALGLAAASLPAKAHAGTELSSGFLLAVLHPWTGADHLLAATAAGMLAVHLGGRGGAAVAAAYLAGLVSGAALGAAGWGMASPLEALLAASVAAFAALLLIPAARTRSLPVVVAGGFAAVHGHAHQLEGAMSVSTAAMGGLVVSTAALVLVGATACHGLSRTRLRKAHVALPLAGAGTLLMLRAL